MPRSSGSHRSSFSTTAHRGGTPDRRQLAALKWLTTIVPALAVFLYETVRHHRFEQRFPDNYGNLIVGLLTLLLAYGFSELVFGIIARLQGQALARQREVIALSAIVEERERLGRELHDGLAQLVAAMLVRLDTVADRLAVGQERAAASEVERLRATTDDFYADIREAITALRTRVSERGLPETLRDYLAEFEEHHGILTELRAAELTGDLPPLAAYQLLRIVQEALANVRKHAEARHAWVACAAPAAGELELVVGDDGIGFVPDREQGGTYGLATMRERVEALGGSLHVMSRPGAGTRVIARLPLVVGRETPYP